MVEGIAGVLFDIDGVVVDSPHERAWREANSACEGDGGSWCYGAGSPFSCCRTCDDVIRAFKKAGWDWWARTQLCRSDGSGEKEDEGKGRGGERAPPPPCGSEGSGCQTCTDEEFGQWLRRTAVYMEFDEAVRRTRQRSRGEDCTDMKRLIRRVLLQVSHFPLILQISSLSSSPSFA